LDRCSRRSRDDAFSRVRLRRNPRERRDQLFERFLPLARKLAGRYASAREPREDLVQVASIGRLGAIDRFDPDRGIRFSAFAVPTILGELRRHFRDAGWSVHVPRGAQELAQLPLECPAFSGARASAARPVLTCTPVTGSTRNSSSWTPSESGRPEPKLVSRSGSWCTHAARCQSG
jgi:RNA polymerase sigma factor (sigma-70 family)